MNPPSREQVGATFLKIANGNRPGDPTWTALDQQTLDFILQGGPEDTDETGHSRLVWAGPDFSPKMRSHNLTQIELDIGLASGCETPGCDHSDHSQLIYLHTRCHPKSPPWAKYEKGGTIMFECSVCRRPLARVAVSKT